MRFPSPPDTTAEQIADALVGEGWLVIADPTAATGESLATALAGIGYASFPTPATMTPEALAILLNADPSLPNPSNALKHWRSW